MDFVAWVNSLSPSAAQFWGAAFGVGGGLTAILLGAFFNAIVNLTRHREGVTMRACDRLSCEPGRIPRNYMVSLGGQAFGLSLPPSQRSSCSIRCWEGLRP